MRNILKKIYWNLIDDKCNNEEKEIMEYVFLGCSFEIIKLIFIIIILSVTNYFKEGLIICLVMFTSKPFIGGYHEKNQLSCFISTLGAILFILIMGENSYFTYLGNAVIAVFSVFCIWNQAPVLNSQMPITKLSLINKNRIIGTSIMALFTIISILVYKKSKYYIFITNTIIFQTLMMFEKNIKLKKDKLE